MNPSSEQRYQIEHFTAYHYSEPVILSHQQLHLTPRPLAHQQVIKHAVAITPTPTLRREFIDPFGNPATEVAVESAHKALHIVAYTTIELSAARVDGSSAATWEDVRDNLAYRAAWQPKPAIMDANQFLFESPHIRVKRSLRAYASDCFATGRPILEAATALMAKIHAEFKFDAKATTVTTPVMTFFEHKHGVCQDFTHLMISCLRSTGLAARYVSGYLMTHPAAGKPRRVGADASHAWVSLFVPDLGWVDFDPTNNVMPGLEHITVGWGRDFSDVTPLRGVINGGGEQKLEVKVTVKPL